MRGISGAVSGDHPNAAARPCDGQDLAGGVCEGFTAGFGREVVAGITMGMSGAPGLEVERVPMGRGLRFQRIYTEIGQAEEQVFASGEPWDSRHAGGEVTSL